MTRFYYGQKGAVFSVLPAWLSWVWLQRCCHSGNVLNGDDGIDHYNWFAAELNGRVHLDAISWPDLSAENSKFSLKKKKKKGFQFHTQSTLCSYIVPLAVLDVHITVMSLLKLLSLTGLYVHTHHSYWLSFRLLWIVCHCCLPVWRWYFTACIFRRFQRFIGPGYQPIIQGWNSTFIIAINDDCFL